MAARTGRATEGERSRHDDRAPDSGAVVETEAFGRLVAARRRFTALAGGAFLVLFLGFIALAGWAHDFMGERIWSGLTVGYALAVVCIVAVWVVAWAYGRASGRTFEPLSERAREEVERP
jgi:uncharacterized membrane protein (DUF485 family)